MPEPGHNELWVKFGAWLRTQRKLADMSQGQLATKAGVHEVSIGRYEKGESGARRDTVIALANALGANVSEALQMAGFSIGQVELDLTPYGLQAQPKKPANLPELLHALEALGIDIVFSTTEEGLENYTPDDFEELKDQIAASVGVKLKSVHRR